ncbi:MAG: methyltransferase, partial [Candidatus Peregrinibacteria bacterium]|nr:methyltransferase [Candidatus Peregrinibacteria bacterium]
ALERPDLRVIATDISEAALKIATQNAKQLNADIDFRLGNLLEPIQNVSEPFLIVSNPPYIPSSETLPQDVYEYEPHSALFSGDDGVNHLQQIVKYASKHPFCCGICIECKTDQCLALA